jgi:four helix bundle protein
MAVADAHGIPIAIHARSAAPAEVTLVHETLGQSLLAELPQRLVADRAYDSDRLARSLDEKGIELIAPHKCNRVNCTQDGRKLRRYRRRWKIERLFAWLKNFRRVANRWDKRLDCYLAFVQLGCIALLVRRFFWAPGNFSRKAPNTISVMDEFGYERLDVYRASMDFLGQASILIDKLPRGYSHLADQLRRASLSISLNIAEGSAQNSAALRSQFYATARASAVECSAVINCCMTLKLLDADFLLTCRTLIYRIVQMLSKLAGFRKRPTSSR